MGKILVIIKFFYLQKFSLKKETILNLFNDNNKKKMIIYFFMVSPHLSDTIDVPCFLSLYYCS